MSWISTGAVVASASTRASQCVRGEVIRKASMSVPVVDPLGISFTNYDLRLPGEDKILNNDDDLIIPMAW